MRCLGSLLLNNSRRSCHGIHLLLLLLFACGSEIFVNVVQGRPFSDDGLSYVRLGCWDVASSSSSSLAGASSWSRIPRFGSSSSSASTKKTAMAKTTIDHGSAADRLTATDEPLIRRIRHQLFFRKREADDHFDGSLQTRDDREVSLTVSIGMIDPADETEITSTRPAVCRQLLTRLCSTRGRRRKRLTGPWQSISSSTTTTLSNRNYDDVDRTTNTVEGASTASDEEDHHGSISSESSFSRERILVSLTQPLMDMDAWEHLKGDEFINDFNTQSDNFQDHSRHSHHQHLRHNKNALQEEEQNQQQQQPPLSSGSNLLDRFTSMCHQVATSTCSDWIDWKECGKHGDVEDGAINIWVGRAITTTTTNNNGNKNPLYCGSHLPIIKSQSIVPGLTPQELAELLLDSSRVRTYNQWSTGRKDVWVRSPFTKIVKNRTKPPVGSKGMVSVTLMHARPMAVSVSSAATTTANKNTSQDWIVVSRAVGGTKFCDDAQDADCGRSDILLGINLLQAWDDDSCLVTAVTHVNSAAVPTMLAEKLGVKGAVQFIKALRRLRPKVPAA